MTTTRTVYFTGIGGAGMSGLALIAHGMGYKVLGSDCERSAFTEQLEKAGIPINYSHDAEYITDAIDLLVYSSAIQSDNPERSAAKKLQIEEIPRGLFLAQLSEEYPTVITVAGSHGKTTITAMLSHILNKVGVSATYMIGGLPCNQASAAVGESGIFLTEVDESDRSQEYMHSTIAIISNLDDDHSWSIGGVDELQNCFRIFASKAQTVIAENSESCRDVLRDHSNVIWVDDELAELRLKLPGRHNRINAHFAIKAAECIGINPADAIAAIYDFESVDRRLSIRYESDELIIVEDYAHHPREVKACIQALREAWPEHNIHVVIQPHRNERVARYYKDFAQELSLADELTVTETFGAWLDDSTIADDKNIVSEIKNIEAKNWTGDFYSLAENLLSTKIDKGLIAILGAGTINQSTGELLRRLNAS
ncbi:MAG: hypothetical protein HRT89_07495 [Lentisphaeria bacterium]|nr:hypothetical protein [Lentisphaeria bacterium]